MNKVFILEERTYDDSSVVYVASSLEKAREKAKQLGWEITKSGFYYKTPKKYYKGNIYEWKVDE